MLETLAPHVTLNQRYSTFIPKFLELRRAELAPLSVAIAAEDFHAIGEMGHKLLGSGSSFGLDHVSNLGEQLETAAKDGDMPALFAAYQDLSNYLENVKITYRNSILFVDDQPEILALLQRLFNEDEYICYFANSAKEALDIMEREAIDVLVSDLVMPEMGGLELLRIVKRRHPQIVRLVLSGQSQVPTILSAISSGQIFRYLTKPWRVDAEAREIIHEAVRHANEINGVNRHVVQLDLDTLIQVLSVTKREYVLAGHSGQVLCSSGNLPEGISAAQGERAPLESLRRSGAQEVSLDLHHTLWMLQA